MKKIPGRGLFLWGVFLGLGSGLFAAEVKSETQISKEPLKMDKQNYTFYNIIPFAPGKEKETAARIREYTALTGNRLVLYSLTLHPEFPSYQKVKLATESFRALKRELAGSDVQLGILLQAILGHWPRVDKMQEGWTRTIDINGNAVRFCPLDQNFCNYIYDVGVALASEGPAMIMSDDDVRAFSPNAECFCPLHTAEFNRRMGTEYTGHEFAEAVKNSKVGDKVYQEFRKLQQEIPNLVATTLRAGIDSVDPDIPSASCMSFWEARFAGETAKCIAGPNHPAAMRICNAYYMEYSAKDFPWNMLKTQALRNYYADIPELLDESDNFPQHLYSRSSRNFHAKICASIFFGLNGAKIWYIDMVADGQPVSSKYTKVLADNQKMYQVLAEEVKKSKPTGVVIPLNSQYVAWHPAQPEQQGEIMVEPNSWAEVQLSAFGIPYRTDFQRNGKDVNLVAGARTVKRFSDEELRQLLAGKVLLDGAAATEITRRGFAKYLGVSAEVKPFQFNSEYDDKTAERYMIDLLPEVPYLTLLDPKAEVRTSLYFQPRFGDSYKEKVAPSTVFFQNELGGTVCTTAFCVTKRKDYQRNEKRKKYLTAVLDRLNGEPLPFVVLNEQDVTAFTRIAQDGKTMMAIFNLNFDRLEPIEIRCAKKPRQVAFLAGNGKWMPVEHTFADGILTLNSGIECMECIFLKID